MCWNESVSLNTFLFSFGVLLLILYNNAFTKYKVEHFKSIYMVLFYASFIFMQLIECFIWRNMNNAFYNRLFSTLAFALLFLQPIASTMLIGEKDAAMRDGLLVSYLALAVPFVAYTLSTKPIHASVSKLGHMRWNFPDDARPPVWIVWFFFFLAPMVMQQYAGTLAFGGAALGVAYFNFQKDHTIGSNWCWAVNAGMLYWAGYLMMYLPLCEHRAVC
jgi:hypothetical protein